MMDIDQVIRRWLAGEKTYDAIRLRPGLFSSAVFSRQLL